MLKNFKKEKKDHSKSQRLAGKNARDIIILKNCTTPLEKIYRLKYGKPQKRYDDNYKLRYDEKEIFHISRLVLRGQGWLEGCWVTEISKN